MCGIIGVIGTNKNVVRQTFISLLLESQIRGRHATGISFLEDGKIVTISLPIPAIEFLPYIPKNIGNIIIGHTRYSTSNIEYNQPLTEGCFSLVHNGVITQAPFEQWENLYGYKDFQTKNDSEILLKALQKNMFVKLENSSIAAGFIAKNELYCFRNEQRPLYIFTTNDEVLGFASTENIIKRGLEDNIHLLYKASPNTLYNFTTSSIKEMTPLNEKNTKQDLQYDTIRGYAYLKNNNIGVGL